MAQTYNKLKIDIKEQVTDIITAKQNDSNSRFLDVYLYDGGVPIDLTGHEVRIYMLKADGTEVFNNGEITNATAGRCQFELTDQALGAYGKLLCEITIWYDNVQILTSPTFDIHVVKNLRTAGSIESSNEYGALVVLYQNLYESIDLMTTMVEQFGEPGEVADAASIATFWQMLEYLYGVNEAALKNASVSEVLERIGLNTDGEGSGTLFGAVNPLSGLIESIYNRITANNLKYTFTASDTLQATIINSEVSRKGSTWSDYAKFIILNGSGSIKITFSVKTVSSGQGSYRFSRNGELVGEAITTTSTTYVTKTIEFFVNHGDVIDFSMMSNSSSYTAYCKLLTVNFDVESHTESLLPEIVAL